MIGRRVNITIGSLAVALLVSPSISAESNTASFEGSLYPELGVHDGAVDEDGAPDQQLRLSDSALTMAPQPSSASSAAPLAQALSEKNKELAGALGPAAFILNDSIANSDFQSLIRHAVGRHPAYHSQMSVLEQSRAERRRARAPLYPQISSQIRGDYSISRDFGPNTDNVVESLRPNEQFAASLSASQLVFDGGATSQRIKSARARESEFQNAISTRINDLSLASLAAYYDLATHKALISLANAIVARHLEILADVKERERLGAGSMADVTRAAARLAAARARLAEIRESERLASVRYQEFFRSEPGKLGRPALTAFAVNTRDQAQALAISNNPEIGAAAARASASQAEYKAAKRGRIPQLRVSVDAVKYDIFDGGDDFDVRAGVDLSYNIFGGGARAAEISLAASRARQDKFAEAEARQSIERDAAIAFEKREGAEARLDALEAAIIAHHKTRDLVLERYRYARGDLIDVLQAENDFFEAGIAYLAALANRDMAIYALMEHTGDLLRFFSPAQEYADLMNEGVND